jgi:hypothetical protein
MPTPALLSIVESPTHPDFSGIYRRLGINETRVGTIRKAISQLKSQTPDFVVAEFFYGYGNNYAGINISNLDVFLYSLQKFAPAARVIVMVDKTERCHVDKLNQILPLHAVLQQPVRGTAMEDLLKAGLSRLPGGSPGSPA